MKTTKKAEMEAGMMAMLVGILFILILFGLVMVQLFKSVKP